MTATNSNPRDERNIRDTLRRRIFGTIAPWPACNLRDL
jgi:hypothetical protein